MENEKLTIENNAGTCEGERVLRLNGPLTLSTLFDFQNAVGAENAPMVILELSGVPYVDSAGLGSIINAHVSCTNAGRYLALVGVSERFRTLLKLTRVESVFTIFPTLEDAERELSKPREL
jgi:anti-sigma B factor antagonist